MNILSSISLRHQGYVSHFSDKLSEHAQKRLRYFGIVKDCQIEIEHRGTAYIVLVDGVSRIALDAQLAHAIYIN